MAIVDTLREDLAKAEGFIGLERFEHHDQGQVPLAAVLARRGIGAQVAQPAEAPRGAEEGRATIFKSYRLRIASVLRDYEMDQRAQAPTDSVAVHG